MSSPRCAWGHYSATANGNFYIWGGFAGDFAKTKAASAAVHRFNPAAGCWTESRPSGPPPPGLYDGASASAGHHLYAYGGRYGRSLHQLDTKSWTWKQLSRAGPMMKRACRMVAYQAKLVLFGGYGVQSGPTQPGAVFVKDSSNSDGSGWTNELHTFDLEDSECGT